MSKTLPAAISAGIAGDAERVTLVRLIPEAGDSWSEYDWATRDITIISWEGGADKVFVGGVLEKDAFTTLRQSVDIFEGGNVATISGLTVRISNPEFSDNDRFDQVFTDNFENRTVEIWLAFWAGANPAYTDILLRYRGVIVDVGYTYDHYEFKIENAAIKRHKNIPDLVLTQEDYPVLPTTNINRLAPLLYGQLYGAVVGMDAYKAVPLIKVDPTKDIFIISRNKMANMAWIDIKIYHDDADVWQSVYPEDLGGAAWSVTYGRPTSIQLVTATSADKNILGSLSVRPKRQGSRTTPSDLDYKNGVDGIPTSYVLLTGGQKMFLKISLPSEIGTIWKENGVKDRLYVNVQHYGYIGGNPAGIIRYYNPEWDDNVGKYSDGLEFAAGDGVLNYNFGNDKSAHGREDDQSDQNDRWTADEIATYEWGIEVNPGCTIRVYELSLVILDTILRLIRPITKSVRRGPNSKAPRRRGGGIGGGVLLAPFDSLASVDNICGAVQGVEFGSWIDEGGRTNIYDQGDLIDAGCWHVESILRDELNLTANEIDVASFDHIGGTSGPRESWAFSNIINTSRNSVDIIRAFCECAASVVFTNYEHKEKILALTKTSSVKTIDRTTLKGKGIIKVSLSPLDSVCNEFVITYNRQWPTGTFLETCLLDASSTNLASNVRAGTPDTFTGLCALSQSTYNLTRKFEFEAEWATTYGDPVDLLMKWFAEWLCFRKYIIDVFTGGLDHLDLELGDQVKVVHTLLPTDISGTANFMLYDISEDLNGDQQTFKFIQIPDLLP